MYGVILAYKESATCNCRLEANYGMQNECDMIPLMMQVGCLFRIRSVRCVTWEPERSGFIESSSRYVWSDIIVVVYQSNYKAKGWLGLIT